jgi:beta-lactamase class A
MGGVNRHNECVLAWCIRDSSGAIIDAQHASDVFQTASIGKVLILTAVAQSVVSGAGDLHDVLARPAPVHDSGLWQHLDQPSITVHDACVLVGGVSDNLAANALLDHVGEAAVNQITDALAIADIALHDRIRDVRTDADPLYPSSGSCAGWSAFMHRLATNDLLNPEVSRLVRGWLQLSVDHSLALAPFALDPLVAERGEMSVVNKTGADRGVRADIGFLEFDGSTLSYAVIATSGADAAHQVRGVGVQLRDHVERRRRISDS